MLFAAALLHDVAKPDARRSRTAASHRPGHAARGARRAPGGPVGGSRRSRCASGSPRSCAITRRPFRPLERDDPDARRSRERQPVGPLRPRSRSWPEADARGRICAEPGRLLDNVALFAESCAEQGCLTGPTRFASDHAASLLPDPRAATPTTPPTRTHARGRAPDAGLPGRRQGPLVRHAPRRAARSSPRRAARRARRRPRRDQAPVIAVARERAREPLRQGAPFAWNATNVTDAPADGRSGCCRLRRPGRDRLGRGVADHARAAEHPERRKKARSRLVPCGNKLAARWEAPSVSRATLRSRSL